MNKIIAFLGFIAACNAASLHIVPAGETIFHQPAVSVVRSAVPAVVPSLVRSVVPVSVSDVELADWEAYKVRSNSILFVTLFVTIILLLQIGKIRKNLFITV